MGAGFDSTTTTTPTGSEHQSTLVEDLGYETNNYSGAFAWDDNGWAATESWGGDYSDVFVKFQHKSATSSESSGDFATGNGSYRTSSNNYVYSYAHGANGWHSGNRLESGGGGVHNWVESSSGSDSSLVDATIDTSWQSSWGSACTDAVGNNECTSYANSGYGNAARYDHHEIPTGSSWSRYAASDGSELPSGSSGGGYAWDYIGDGAWGHSGWERGVASSQSGTTTSGATYSTIEYFTNTTSDTGTSHTSASGTGTSTLTGTTGTATSSSGATGTGSSSASTATGSETGTMTSGGSSRRTDWPMEIPNGGPGELGMSCTRPYRYVLDGVVVGGSLTPAGIRGAGAGVSGLPNPDLPFTSPPSSQVSVPALQGQQVVEQQKAAAEAAQEAAEESSAETSWWDRIGRVITGAFSGAIAGGLTGGGTGALVGGGVGALFGGVGAVPGAVAGASAGAISGAAWGAISGAIAGMSADSAQEAAMDGAGAGFQAGLISGGVAGIAKPVQMAYQAAKTARTAGEAANVSTNARVGDRIVNWFANGAENQAAFTKLPAGKKIASEFGEVWVKKSFHDAIVGLPAHERAAKIFGSFEGWRAFGWALVRGKVFRGGVDGGLESGATCLQRYLAESAGKYWWLIPGLDHTRE